MLFHNFAVINKKRMTEEKKLNTGLEKYTVLRRDYVHQSHDVCHLQMYYLFFEPVLFHSSTEMLF